MFPLYARASGMVTQVYRVRQMAWRVSGTDSTTSVAPQAALKAFEAARRTGRTTVECYRAGVAAWRCAHPDHSAEYSAKQAVSAILARHAKLRIEE
jgi:hypothetical protein